MNSLHLSLNLTQRILKFSPPEPSHLFLIMLPDTAVPFFLSFSLYFPLLCLAFLLSFYLLLWFFYSPHLCPSITARSFTLSGCFVSPRHNATHSYYIKRHWHQFSDGYTRLHNPMIQMMKEKLRQMDRNLGESWKERLMRGTQALVWVKKYVEGVVKFSGSHKLFWTSSWEWQLRAILIMFLRLLGFVRNP